MSPRNPKFNRTRRQRYYRRRAVRGPLKALVKKQKRWWAKKRNFRFLKRIDTSHGFQYARYIWETTPGPVPTSGATSPGYFNLSFTLSTAAAQSQIIAAWSRIFEYYRIRKVVVSIIPNFTQSQASTASGGGIAPYYLIGSILNTDNDTAPAAGAPDFSNWPNGASYKETRGTKWHTRVLKPVPTLPVGDTHAMLSYSNTKPKWAPWISTGDPAVAHYGLQVYIRVLNAAFPDIADVPFRMRIKFYYAFKSFSKYAV